MCAASPVLSATATRARRSIAPTMLRIWAVALALSAAHPAAAQWVRVSVAADGTAPNGDSHSGVMSASNAEVDLWMRGRVAGDAPPTSCGA